MTKVIEAPPPPVSRELKRRGSYYFIRKVYEADPLVCPKLTGEMGIISFIDQLAVIIYFIPSLYAMVDDLAAVFKRLFGFQTGPLSPYLGLTHQLPKQS